MNLFCQRSKKKMSQTNPSEWLDVRCEIDVSHSFRSRQQDKLGIACLGFFCYSTSKSVSSGNVTLVLIPSPAIGNAFAVLSNPEKRLRYDELGSDHEHVSSGQARHYNYYTEFEADITPEEIFNVFFGGHFPTGNIHMFSNVARDAHYYPRRHRAERAWTQEPEEEEHRPQNSYSAFIQLMPVFIIIIVSVITQLMATNPPYSLFYKSSIGHVVSRETENLQVPYYVDKNFEKNYQGAELQELEKTVEKDYIDYIQTSCWKEKQQKSDLSNLAKLYRDERLKQKAESLKLEHCEKLSSLIGMHKGG
uniref:DnaJ heat shock protein family (Hsp40) member C18 n=1 Tax=Serinus canaria TaxID=9135 RepID=A0A8C9NWW4_SERCA